MAYEGLCDPAHCCYPYVLISLHACVPKLTKQLSHQAFVLALPSTWNVLLPETHMVCFHGSLLECHLSERSSLTFYIK